MRSRPCPLCVLEVAIPWCYLMSLSSLVPAHRLAWRSHTVRRYGMPPSLKHWWLSDPQVSDQSHYGPELRYISKRDETLHGLERPYKVPPGHARHAGLARPCREAPRACMVVQGGAVSLCLARLTQARQVTRDNTGPCKV